MSLYNLKRLAQDTYMIAKFTDDFTVEATYTLVQKGFSYLCDCPANNRSVVTKPCRHKLMMPTLRPKVDTDEFYDHDTGRFCTPLGDLLRLEAKPEVSVLEAEAEIVGEALGSSVQQTETHIVEYLTNEPPRYNAVALSIDVPPSPAPASLPPSAPTIRRR